MGFVAWPGLASTWVVEQREQLKLSLCRCKKKVSATKRFTIHRAPRVLTLALKRFADFTGGKITKVSAQQSRAGLCPVPRPCCPEQGGRWFCALVSSTAVLQPFPSCAVLWWEFGSSRHLPHRGLCLGRVGSPSLARRDS